MSYASVLRVNARGHAVIALGLLIQGLSACRPTRHLVVYDVAANRITSAPTFVGTGDSLILRVKYNVYADRYAGTTTAEALTEVITPAVAGNQDIKRMADALLPSGLFKATTTPTVASTETEPNVADDLSNRIFLTDKSLISNLRRIDDVETEIEHTDATKGDATIAAREREELVKSMTAALEVREQVRTKACSTAVDALAEDILAKPGHAALLAFMLDADARSLAHNVATDSFPDRVIAAAKTLEQPGKQLDVETIKSLIDAVPDYARKLQLLLLHIGADGASAAPDEEFSKRLVAARSCEAALSTVDADLAGKIESANVRLHMLNSRVKGGPTADFALPKDRIVVPETRVVAGVDLARFAAMTKPALGEIESLFSDLAIAAQRTTRVALALNTLPRYTEYKAEEDLPLAAYYSPTRVAITITRADRIGRITITPLVSLAPSSPGEKADEQNGSKPGGKSAQDSGEKGDKPKAQSDEKQEPKPIIPAAAISTLQLPTPVSPDGQPLPSTKVDVLQRYRYRFSLGLTRSWLDAKTYELKQDTLRVTGLAPTRVFPTAALSVAILPLSGQFLAGQASAWRGWAGWNWRTAGNLLSRLGLWGQVGLSLNDPTKQIFLGAATDPFPGVTFAMGCHIGYADVPNFAVDGPVPTSQPATRKKWQSAQAITLSLDANIIFSTFGALLGLK